MPAVLRKTVDPNVGVSQLMTAVKSHLDRHKTKDLQYSLQVPGGKDWGWKKAPIAAWMAKLAPLAHDLVLVAPNGVVGSAKLKLAIQKLLDDHKMTTSDGQDVSDCVTLCDQMMRVLLQAV